MTAVRMPAGAVDSEIPVTRDASVGVGARRAFAEGARAQVPMAMGVAPFGLAIGAAVSASNVPAPVGWLGAPHWHRRPRLRRRPPDRVGAHIAAGLSRPR